jgi:hypothetical protein
MAAQHGTSRRRLGLGFMAMVGAVSIVLASAAPSFANTIVIVGIDKEGNLIAHPGDIVSAGYLFKFPTNHPEATVLFANAVATFPFHCTANDKGPADGSFQITFGAGPYTVAENDNKLFPGGSKLEDPANFQGSFTLDDECGEGNPIYLNYGSGFGATFTADVQSTDTTDKIEVHFHYAVPGAKGKDNIDCSDPVQNPSPGSSACGSSMTGAQNVFADQIPVGTIGLIGLTLLLGIGLMVRQARSRRLSVAARGNAAFDPTWRQ